MRFGTTKVQRMDSREHILDNSQLSTVDETTLAVNSGRSRFKKKPRNKAGVKEYLRIFCFQNLTSSFILVVTVLILKLCMTTLYVIRVQLDDLNSCTYCGNSSNLEEDEINWNAILWVQKPLPIWAIEVAISIFTLTRMLIVTYVRFKGNCCKIFTLNLCVEVVVSLPIIITLCQEDFRQFYIPSFLNCWLAKRMLDQNVLSHRNMVSLPLFTQRAVDVTTTLICLLFTGVCGVQHIQRASSDHFNLFQSFYFVMVTFSTVGYGDFSPDIWPSQLLVIVLIVVAVVVLPKEFESLASSWMERQRMGGSYGHGGEMKHVVFCSTIITDEVLENFLNEFFSHRHLQDYYVVFMSASEPDPAARRVLHSPLWLHRVMFIKGSLLRDADLIRAGIKDAKACFLMGDDIHTDKSESDQHTILRSWSVKDYAPNAPLYIQIYRPENKAHLRFSKFTVCEEEFKYAMLAYNCLIPGTSTLLSLLLHTSKGDEGQMCSEQWLKLYGKHAGNEIYSVQLSESYIFGDYVGKNFAFASLNGHKNYGVALIGVQPTKSPDSILLNPGFSYVLKDTDLLFYLSMLSEEDIDFDRQPILSNDFSNKTSQAMLQHTSEDMVSKVQDGKSAFRMNIQVGEDLTTLDTDETNKFVYDNPSLPTLDDYKSVDDSSARWITETEQCEYECSTGTVLYSGHIAFFLYCS